IAGTHEQPHDSFKIIIALHDEENWFLRIKHPARPDGENWRASDVERAGNVTATKRKHGTHIYENTSFLVDCFLERLGRKAGNARKIHKHFWTLRVHSFHQQIIMRHGRRTFDRVISETFRVSELQKFIELSLVTDRAAQSCSDVGPAWRTSAVIGINHHVIG